MEHLLGVHVQIDHHVERVGVEVVVGQPGGTCVQEALHEPPIQRLPFLSCAPHQNTDVSNGVSCALKYATLSSRTDVELKQHIVKRG